MPTAITAHAFWVRPLDGDPAILRQLAVQMGQNDQVVEFAHSHHNYHAAEASWHAGRNALAGTIFKLREENLPAAVRDDGDIGNLPIDQHTNLGEPMCFAYYPDLEAAFVQYSHNGARHPTIAAMLAQAGFAHPIEVKPVLKTDMLARLDDTVFVSSLEFALSDPEHIQAMRAGLAPVGGAIDLMGGLNGVNIQVKVSIGRQRNGPGLAVDAVRGIGHRLLQFGETEVSTLKVRGTSHPDVSLETLDLLRARVSMELEIANDDRYMDRQDCRTKLLNSFEASIRPTIVAQRNQGP